MHGGRSTFGNVAAMALPLMHLNLDVADVERSIAFYRTWFGFSGEPRTYPDGTVFISNSDQFDLALHPASPPSPPAPAVHFGFRSPRAEDVRHLRERLQGAGIEITEAYDEDHFVNLKCLDPDGYEIEVYWEA